MMNEKKHKVAFLSSYPPRHCGIGEFTADKVRNVMKFGVLEAPPVILPLDKSGLTYLYPIEQHHIINQMDTSSYEDKADLVIEEDAIAKTKGKRLVLSAEHEFGLDGNGRNNNYNFIGRKLNEAGVLSVITMHTVVDPKLSSKEELTRIKKFQKDIVCGLGKNYTKIIVLTPTAKKVLTANPYNIDPDKIVYIPHGIIEIDRRISKESKKRRFGYEGRTIVGTPGMVSENKGLEGGLRGFSAYLRSIPQSMAEKTNWVIYGGTHQEILDYYNGEDPHREKLWNIAEEEKLNPIEEKNENINRKRKLDLDKHKVIFVNAYVQNSNLEEFIGSIDIGYTPYKVRTQCASGIGAKLAGHGIPCVSTDFMFHDDLFRDENGKIDNSGYLVKFGKDGSVDPDELAKGFSHVLKHYDEMRAKILGKGVRMGWTVVGAQLISLYTSLANSR